MVPCVVRAHACGSASFVRASAGAAGREGCGAVPRWLGLSAPALLLSDCATYRALFALKEQCRQFVVLDVLLLLVHDVVFPVRPDARV